ncbi:hypothetical protein ACQEU6_46180 [Spirillospora sp. CA-108201]
MTNENTPAHISDACVGELGVPRDRTCEDCADAACQHECHRLSTVTAHAVAEAIAEVIGAQLRPALASRIGEVPGIAWTLHTDDHAAAWMVDGLGPVRVSAQIAVRDLGEIRAFIAETARVFDGQHVREVSPFPGRPEITNVEVTVSVEGIPVTVWGTTGPQTDGDRPMTRAT